MTTVAAGSNATIQLAFGQSLSVYSGGGNFFDLTTSPVAGVTRTRSYGPLQTRHIVPPMPLGGSVVVNCTFGSVNYDLIGGSGNGLTAAISPSGSQAIGTVFTCAPDANFVGTPSYQWKLDGVNVGTNSSTYTSAAAGVVTCVVTGHQITASGATVYSPPNSLIANAPFVLLGDSETNYGQISNSGVAVSFSTLTFDRDTSGLVTVNKGTAHGFVGHCLTSWFNIVNDPSLEAVAETYVTGPNQFQYQTAVTGLPLTGVAGTAAGGMMRLNRFNQTGYWLKLNSAFGGGLKYCGNFGQPGDTTDVMGKQIQLACAALAGYPSGQKFAVFAPGVNDATGLVAAATIRDRAAVHLATLKAAGIKTILLTPPPFDGTSYTSARGAILDAIPARFAELETADPTWVKVANGYPAMVSATPGLAAANMINPNDVHLTSLGSRKNVDALVPRVAEWVATSAILPTGPGQTPTFTDGQGKVFQLYKDYTSWDGATTAATGVGCTGVSPQLSGFSNQYTGNASMPVTSSVVARTDGVAGYMHRLVWTDLSTNASTCNLTAQSFTPISLATLGLSAAATSTTPWALGTADEILYIEEIVRHTNQNGALCSYAGAYLRDQGGLGSFLDLSAGRGSSLSAPHYGGAQYADPDYGCICVTGSQVIPPGVTGLSPSIEFKFSTTGGSSMTIDVGRRGIWRRIA